jgi:hypothetical protein
VVWALIEDELPCVGRKCTELQSSTFAREEGVVLPDLDWAVIGECRSLGAKSFNTLDTCFDFDMARHVIPMPNGSGINGHGTQPPRPLIRQTV